MISHIHHSLASSQVHRAAAANAASQATAWPAVPALQKKDTTEPLMQMKVPDGSRQNGHPKEAPETAPYRPLRNDEPFTRGTDRKKFSFGLHTRPTVLEKAGVRRVTPGGHVVAVAADGQAVPVHAVDLDHSPVPWSKISDHMADYNERLGAVDPYTIYDAKLYYNDVSNLTPILSGVNSAYGDGSRPVTAQINPLLQAEMLHTQAEWSDLQHNIGAASIDDDEQALLFGQELLKIRQQMSEMKGRIHNLLGLT